MKEIIVFFMLVITIGLIVEKSCHMDFSFEEVCKALKKDVIRLIMVLKPEPKRHIFDAILADDLCTITKPYNKIGFEICTSIETNQNVPTIAIRFVPDHNFDATELVDLSSLLHLKFKEYMEFYNLPWKSFVTYSVGSDYVHIFMYFCEMESDLIPFTQLYRRTIRKNINRSGGILRDKGLEEELKHVS